MKKSFRAEAKEAGQPIKNKEEVQENADEHIDQDFPGYPHAPSQEKNIKPVTKDDKSNAQPIKKDNKGTDSEENSDGSANAFSESENDVLRGELDDDDNDKKTY